MKKKLGVLFIVFAVIIGCSGVVIWSTQKGNRSERSEITVVTSFYPMYILTENLAKNVPGVKVVNLTENQTGCLHDYQLTTQDMIEIDHASMLVLNGGGMEGFIEGVIEQYPELPVVKASEGIELLPATSQHSHEHNHEDEENNHHESEEEAHVHEDGENHSHESEEEAHVHEHEDNHSHEEESQEAHYHGEYNAHVWMNMNDYLVQMETVYEALVDLDPVHESLYETNYKEYREKVEELKEEFEEVLNETTGKEVVIFHDSFAYLAQEIGLDIVYTVNLDDETYLSAGEVKEIIDEVKKHGIQVLFTEQQYSDSIAKSIANETDAMVYVIDSLVTGENNLDAYLNGMRNNLKTVKEAFQ